VLLVVSIATLALGVVTVPIVVTRIPADYFVRTSERPSAPPRGKGPGRLLLFWLRNAAGALLVMAGVLMLVLPGQGVLTILAGLSLLSFPGKRAIELRILRTRAVHRAIDALRVRAGKPPLLVDEEQGVATPRGERWHRRHSADGRSDSL
jgi:hypothetical protein